MHSVSNAVHIHIFHTCRCLWILEQLCERSNVRITIPTWYQGRLIMVAELQAEPRFGRLMVLGLKSGAHHFLAA